MLDYEDLLLVVQIVEDDLRIVDVIRLFQSIIESEDQNWLLLPVLDEDSLTLLVIESCSALAETIQISMEVALRTDQTRLGTFYLADIVFSRLTRDPFKILLTQFNHVVFKIVGVFEEVKDVVVFSIV